ncbi:hypothetical protein SDC9_165985 [bioreactor metagenome]|uniref:Uncharacterized protein n=1 Tax=bioreactor metagenome TaxID=1076179 RepID=A0A645G3A6_9ZZZZ
MQHGEFLQHSRKRRIELFKILKGKNLAGNLPKNGSNAIFLIEEIGTEPGDIGDLIPEIDVPGFFEDFDLVLRSDFVEHFLQLIILKRGVVDPLHLAIDAEHRIVPRRKVQVRGFLLEH